MTDTIVHKIKAPSVPNFKFETLDYKAALARLAEVQQQDPQAKLVNVPMAGR